jgi:hypothetical protein
MIAEHRGPRAQCTATWYTVHEICNICYTVLLPVPSFVFNGKEPLTHRALLSSVQKYCNFLLV